MFVNSNSTTYQRGRKTIRKLWDVKCPNKGSIVELDHKHGFKICGYYLGQYDNYIKITSIMANKKHEIIIDRNNILLGRVVKWYMKTL